MSTRTATRNAVNGLRSAPSRTLADSKPNPKSNDASNGAKRATRAKTDKTSVNEVETIATTGRSLRTRKSQGNDAKTPEKETKKSSAPSSKRKRTTEKPADELLHNLGKVEVKPEEDVSPAKIKAEDAEGTRKRAKRGSPTKNSTSPSKNAPKSPQVKIEATEDVKAKVEDLAEQVEPSKKKSKKNPYGLSPGQSPFPDFKDPSPEACEEVASLLEKVHGKVSQPKTIPAPSLEVSGCGEVPSILDALIRTLLSAATNNRNSSRAFQGLVSKFGLMEEGIGKGSVNWNKVREAKLSDVFEAIKSGGLAHNKSKNIKKILDRVYEINVARRDALVKEKEQGAAADIKGSKGETQGQKDDEIARADANMLSLDFMHSMSAEEAMQEFVKFPGIGVKTASCVLLFCMQRPSFAVDTHVYRLCQWLKWVPKGATRDQTFSHLETKIPDHLKYSLHYLFIRHGRTCRRCRAITSPGTQEWENANCPIEHLVTRTGRKAVASSESATPKKRTSKAKARGRKKAESETEESDSSVTSYDEESD